MRRLASHLIQLVVVGLLAASVTTATAHNPRIDLKLENVTLRETVERLSSASGVPVTLPGDSEADPAAPGAQAEPKASFDWRGASFATALRELCARFQLTPNRNPAGYFLFPSGAPPAPPPAAARPRVAAALRGGLELRVTSLSISGATRFLDLAGDQDEEESDGTLSIALRLAGKDLEQEQIVGIRNVTARDDRGTLLRTPDSDGGFDDGYDYESFPDEWRTAIELSEPHPQARRLDWIEGDLWTYKRVERRKVEVQLPPAVLPFEAATGPVSIRVIRYEPSRPLREGEPPDPFAARQGRDGRGVVGPRLEIEYVFPANGAVQLNPQTVQPVILTDTGQVIFGNYVGGSGDLDAQGRQVQRMAMFFQVPGPRQGNPRRVVWTLTQREEPVRYAHFRLLNVPLPPPHQWRPQAAPARTAAPPPPGGEVTHPFHQPGGGTLTGDVLVGSAQAGLGRLSLGLSPLGDGDGATRWIDLQTDETGKVRLTDIKPGRYRVLRRFAPAAAIPGDGAWTGEDVTIEIVAAREAALPPLRWTPAVARKPAAAKKPAATVKGRKP